MTTCTRCESTGFLNLDQIGSQVDEMDTSAILAWIQAHNDYDVQVCDCCGDGEEWHGTPGGHYGPDDPGGHDGPYAYNGGLCECN